MQVVEQLTRASYALIAGALIEPERCLKRALGDL
jgi:hypothetical protein